MCIFVQNLLLRLHVDHRACLPVNVHVGMQGMNASCNYAAFMIVRELACLTACTYGRLCMCCKPRRFADFRALGVCIVLRGVGVASFVSTVRP